MFHCFEMIVYQSSGWYPVTKKAGHRQFARASQNDDGIRDISVVGYRVGFVNFCNS